MRFKLFLFCILGAGLLRAQNGVAISVSGPTSVCPNQLYQYTVQVVASNVCFFEVTSTGGHRVTCGATHNLSDTSPTSDYGYFMTPYSSPLRPFDIYTTKSFCMHWVSSGSKSLCFAAYDCNGNVLSSFCITITNNSPTLTVQGTTYLCNGQWAYFTVPCGLSNYIWSVTPDNFETISVSGGGCVANIGNLNNNSWHLVQVQAVDCWGTTKYGSKSFWTTSCLQSPEEESEVVDRSGPTGESTETGIQVYPNPTGQGRSVSVQLQDAPVAIQTYQLFSVDGKLLKNGNLAEAAKMFELEMPDTPGVYLLILTDSNYQQSRHKVVVTR